MRLFEREIKISKTNEEQLLEFFKNNISEVLNSSETPVRFAVTSTDQEFYHCEIGVLLNEENYLLKSSDSIFNFQKRKFENTDKFNCVLIIPTGIGAEIGGHCGDGNAVARLVASGCDTLITHPNVVNASDINEMTENTLYVEGSIITRLLMGQIGLQKSRSNRILMMMDEHEDELFNNEIVNAVSSARISLGIDCDVLKITNKVNCTSLYSGSGRAVGKVANLEKLYKLIHQYKNGYDAIGLSTFINVPEYFHKKYFEEDNMINPWGGIEAMLTHAISTEFNIPSAHSPMMTSREIMEMEVGIVEPRKAPETSSTTYLHCILKGLHKSPRIVASNKGLNVEDISCIIIPDGCIGLPVLAAIEQEIPVIAVTENKNRMKNNLQDYPFEKGKLVIVENYLEAIGVMNALKAGIDISTIRRPITNTNIIENNDNIENFEVDENMEIDEKFRKNIS